MKISGARPCLLYWRSVRGRELGSRHMNSSVESLGYVSGKLLRANPWLHNKGPGPSQLLSDSAKKLQAPKDTGVYILEHCPAQTPKERI